MNTPRDGASTTFEKDTWLELLSSEEEGKLFGVVLVANWPPEVSITGPYESILPSLRQCFDDVDYAVTDDENLPAVYIYPPETLHITLATFTTFNTSDEVANREQYSQACKEVMEKSFCRKDWPKGKIEIEIERTQVGSKAGIFLWKNENGQIATMRKIIHEEFNTLFKKNPQQFCNKELIIPGIIHSTFLRFGHVPKSNGDLVQERLKKMQSKIKDSFGKVELKTVRLAIERTPYMHIPFNDRHVLTSREESS